ncbi:MAG: DUF3467 domain-containing protein [Zetaproteobacteria bacterium]|nr:MAG: DUF3467 domain-containing protein [Zetaproteobacteria bacterium]
MQLQMPPEIQGGVYANQTMVTHTPEEFVFDFMLITPPVATVNARVIVTPAHAKRIAAVLAENIRKYEAMFGEVEANLPPEPDTGQMH